MQALLRTVRVNVQPVCTQVRFKLRANSPLSVGPQWATVSPSKKPGAASISSVALRILIDEPQQRRGFGGGLALDLIAGLRRRQVAVDRRRAHRQQFGAHPRAVTVTAKTQLAVAFLARRVAAASRQPGTSALPTRGGPDLSAAPLACRRSTSAFSACVAAWPHCGLLPVTASRLPTACGRRCRATSQSPRPPDPESVPCPSSTPSHTPWRTWR